jgi:hypothetical protein
MSLHTKNSAKAAQCGDKSELATYNRLDQHNMILHVKEGQSAGLSSIVTRRRRIVARFGPQPPLPRDGPGGGDGVGTVALVAGPGRRVPARPGRGRRYRRRVPPRRVPTARYAPAAVAPWGGPGRPLPPPCRRARTAPGTPLRARIWHFVQFSSQWPRASLVSPCVGGTYDSRRSASQAECRRFEPDQALHSPCAKPRAVARPRANGRPLRARGRAPLPWLLAQGNAGK